MDMTERLSRIENDVAETRNDVSDIKKAVIGNPEFGQLGLVQRVDSIEKQLRAAVLRTAVITGAVTASVFILKALFKI
jgi:hypothetical protein